MVVFDYFVFNDVKLMFSIGESCDDGAEYGRSVVSPESNWHFLFVLYVIFMFLALDVVCLIVYNRQTLLEIGSTITHRTANRTLNSSTPV